jgi:hypothetical protein
VGQVNLTVQHIVEEQGRRGGAEDIWEEGCSLVGFDLPAMGHPMAMIM